MALGNSPALVSLMIAALLGLFALQGCSDEISEFQDTSPIVVITDMEPDDRIALHLLVALYPERISLVGTTVMHSFRKKVLAERLLRQLDMAHIPVVQGSGGYADDYPNIATSRAGREYDLEGTHVLEQSELQDIAKQPRSSDQLRVELRRILSANDSVEIFILAPPTDLSNVLEESPELASHISRVHLMGGWVEVRGPGGSELRTTYNWNMDPRASKQLLESQAFPITLYSSHVVKKHFSGGSLQRAAFPELFELLVSSSERLPSVAETFIAGNSWDNHLMDRIPKLESAIGRENAGMQFSPADPTVVVGAFEPNFVKKKTPIGIRLDDMDIDPKSGYRVIVEPLGNSRIELVEDFDEAVFRSVFTRALQTLEPNPLGL